MDTKDFNALKNIFSDMVTTLLPYALFGNDLAQVYGDKNHSASLASYEDEIMDFREFRLTMEGTIIYSRRHGGVHINSTDPIYGTGRSVIIPDCMRLVDEDLASLRDTVRRRMFQKLQRMDGTVRRKFPNWPAQFLHNLAFPLDPDSNEILHIVNRKAITKNTYKIVYWIGNRPVGTTHTERHSAVLRTIARTVEQAESLV